MKFLKLKIQISNLEDKEKNSSIWLEDKDKNKLQNLKNQIQEIESMLTKYEKDNIRTFFLRLPFWAFSENWGFDIVIGNPPYIKEYENNLAFLWLKNKEYYI